MKRKIILVLAIGVILTGFILFIARSSGKKKETAKPRVLITEKGEKKSQPAGSLSKVLKEAQGAFSLGDYGLSKLKYQELINNYSNSDKVAIWQKTVDDINTKIILNGIMAQGFIIYEVKAGDSLSKIAKEFNTTVDLLKRSNYLKGDIISKGKKLKVWTKKFSCFVDKSQNILLLKTGDEVIKTYIVSTGLNNSTPVGAFRVINKIVNPTWYKNGLAISPSNPENILGTRWMGWDMEGYGIHGTTDPANLGKQITQGCVRMKNEDVEELYIFLPVGSEVTVVD